MHYPTDRKTHTTAFVTPVVEHWLKRDIVQWVHHEISIRPSIAPRANTHTNNYLQQQSSLQPQKLYTEPEDEIRSHFGMNSFKNLTMLSVSSEKKWNTVQQMKTHRLTIKQKLNIHVKNFNKLGLHGMRKLPH